MKQTLSIKNTIGMGFLTFAMFLGAGNLIFPPMAGYLSGVNIWQAALGFLITGVGLPLLAIVTISRVGGNFNAITQELPPWVVTCMGICIFLLVGPLYAVPRTAVVAYEIGVIPFLKDTSGSTLQLLFCTIFFFLTWIFCLQPGKLLEFVGKIITPALIILLIILGLSPIVVPQGEIGNAIGPYSQAPFLNGFLEGYLTMDALAAFVFGVVIMTNLKSHGISEQKTLTKYSIYTGLIAAIGLTLVYISLFYLGATTRDIITNPSTGGQILARYVEHLSGPVGSIFLSLVITLACLTTAIGCISSAGEYFDKLTTNKLSYSWIVTIMSISCIIIASMNLNQLIQLFTPVLLALYPSSIALILLGLIKQHIPNPTLTYRITLLTIFIFSLIDVSQDMPVVAPLINAISFLPGLNVHMGWLAPGIISFLITLLLGWLIRVKPSPIQKG
ncbi:MAG: branched-chain amino acid transport system II carrier protein [Candidatus Endonucleobacter sp. (ex Gigantidas childressi)]|nr:branched-chain amino acid transport system II carrier protein [Candidatus Endonucleobacter sp. (ex Gigantidas childressi)]